MKAIRLRTEYLKKPLGIDMEHPRLLWNCEGGKTQTAFQILAETEEKTVWDSGKVSSASMHARLSRTAYLPAAGLLEGSALG